MKVEKSGKGLAIKRMRHFLIVFAVGLAVTGNAAASALDTEKINAANWEQPSSKKISPVLIKAQVLLDRLHFSPGEIDGKLGENFEKAVRAYAKSAGSGTADFDESMLDMLVAASPGPITVDYQLTVADVRGPFEARIPSKMEDMKELRALSYRTPREAIAERFHMSEELLSLLNPGSEFDQAEARIVVVNVRRDPFERKASRLEVDKSAQTVSAFDASGKLLSVYPATVGSKEKPAPDGTLKITKIAKNPVYQYNPDYAFKGVRSSKPFKIAAGPNNPVGSVWMALSEKSYGIHGTPEPSKVSKTESHGCIRLTNWDALELSSLVERGVTVDFVGQRYAPGTKTKT